MNRFGYWVSFWVTIVALVGVSCAPKATRTPLPVAIPNPVPAPATQPAVGAAILPLEDSEWAKVVEAAKKEGKVTAYSYYWIGDTGLAIAAAFQERYGIKLDIITGRGAEFAERLKVERRMGKPVADINEGGLFLITAKEAGLTLSSADLPVLKQQGIWAFDPRALDTSGHVLVYIIAYRDPIINTNLVKPNQEPHSYRDLLGAQWKGKIVAADPIVSSIMYSLFVSLIRDGQMDWEFVKALGQQGLTMRRESRDITAAVARGEFSIGLVTNAMIAGEFTKEGSPLKLIPMAEGSLVYSSNISIINGPNPNAARLLVNWLLSKEGLMVAGKMMDGPTVRSDVPDFTLPSLRYTPKRMTPFTSRDNDEVTKLMREKFLEKLWRN